MSESTPNKDMPVIDTSAEAHTSQAPSDADIPVENNDDIAAPEMSPEMQALTDEIVGALKSVYDPEIPVDIYELGLIYDVFVNEDQDVKVLMTLTTPNCPVADSLPQEVKDKVQSLNEVKEAEVELTFDPPWTRDLMSEEAKLELGFL